MKHKKAFIIICLTMIILLSTILLNKIFAANNKDNNIESLQTGGMWYTIETAEDGTERLVEGTHYTDIRMVRQGVYREDLENYFDVFCMDTDKYPLPFGEELESNVYKVVNKIDGVDPGLGYRYMYSYRDNSYDRSKWGKNVVDGTFSNDGKRLTTSKDLTSTTHSYYSRTVNRKDLDIDTYSTELTGDNFLDYDLAYVLTQVDDTVPDDGSVITSHSLYQTVVWKITRPELENENGYHWYTLSEEATVLYQKAQIFKSYRKNFERPALSIPVNSYKYKYVKDGDYFIAGPMKFNYGDLTVGDENGNELEVGKIEKYTLIGKATINGKYTNVEIVDFEFTDKDGNNIELIDANESLKFPKTGETFYLKILNTDPMYNLIEEISTFEVSFKYLDVEAKVWEIKDYSETYGDGAIRYYKWTPKTEGGIEEKEDNYWEGEGDYTRSEIEELGGIHTWCAYYGEDGEIKEYENSGKTCKAPKATGGAMVEHWIKTTEESEKSYYLQRSASPVYKTKLQDLLVLNYAKLYWRNYKLTVEFERDDQQPTYFDIGGKVWVDEPTDDKVHDENGICDSNEKGRQNVKVQLFFEDGTPVIIGINALKDGTKVEVINVLDGVTKNTALVDDANNKGQEYIMYTDENGDYMFYYLPMGYKYYVVFTYDGMMYEPTTYLAGGSEIEYKKSPNATVYETNSKAQENAEDRTKFNSKVEKVFGSGATSLSNGYTRGMSTGVSDLLYKSKLFDDKFQSRLLTTDNEADVENNLATGKVRAAYEMTSKTNVSYPFGDDFTIWSVENGDELEYLKHINLGLVRRKSSDLALQTQIKAGAMTIKDKEKVVFYKSNVTDDKLIIDGTSTQDEYIKQEISASDYYWAANYDTIYDDGGNITGYIIDEEQLNVYVLYRIVVQDQCTLESEYGVVNEIIDYYDNRLEMVPDKEKTKVSGLFNVNGFTVPSGAISWIEGTTTKIEWTSTNNTINGYNQIVAKDLNLTVGKDSKTSAIYLILKVKNNGDIIYTGTDSDRDGIQNIAEISSYNIYNADGTVAGKVDCDSAPANAIPGNKETYEDDTDPAPMFRLEINWTPRTISGNVWEDLNENGILDDSKGIENVTVKLMEYIIKDNGDVVEIERPGLILNTKNKTITVSRSQSIKTDKNGKYSFNVEGGNYAIKFIYGNTEMLIGTNANKKYNGQDYQATTYTPFSSIDGNAYKTVEDLKNGITNKLVTDELNVINQNVGVQANWETTTWGKDTSNKLSAARDVSTIRANIINNTRELTYDNASKLNELNVVNSNKSVSSDEVAKYLSGNNNTNTNYTYMEAITDIITIASNDLVKTEKVMNLGLKERPEASIKLEKEVERIVLTANDGTVLIDTSDSTKQSNLQKLDDIQETFLNMDAVLMDGATVDIDYKLKVTNDATEDDCLANYVYIDSDKDILSRLGNLNDKLSVKATIFDYVSINLEYRADDNTQMSWDKVYDGDSKPSNVDGIILADSVLETLPRTKKVVSKVLSTSSTELTHSDSNEFTLHLGITLAENTSDTDLDFIFSNSAEVVKINSQAGRRDYETIPGNYVPYSKVTEDDSAKTGSTAITPPLGQERIYYVITVVAAGILIGGIILIKKKVLKK